MAMGIWLQKIRFCVMLMLAIGHGVMQAEPADAGSVVRVGGAGSGLGAMKQLAAAFQKSHPGVEVQVMPSLGSSGGIKALLQGALDMAVSGRSLKDDELRAGAVAEEYARSPFVFITHKDVAKKDLSPGELERIYDGQMLNWPDGSRVRLVLRPAGDTDTKIVESISPAMEQAVKSALSRKGMILAVTDQDCAEAVAGTPGAIGASTLTEITSEKRPVKALSYKGVMPTVKALAEGRYPLVKPLYLVTTAKASPTAKQFKEFVGSAQGREILRKSGNLVTKAGKGR